MNENERFLKSFSSWAEALKCCQYQNSMQLSKTNVNLPKRRRFSNHQNSKCKTIKMSILKRIWQFLKNRILLTDRNESKILTAEIQFNHNFQSELIKMSILCRMSACCKIQNSTDRPKRIKNLYSGNQMIEPTSENDELPCNSTTFSYNQPTRMSMLVSNLAQLNVWKKRRRNTKS